MLFTAKQRVILASASPRRNDFLSALGLEFTIMPADVPETPDLGESPENFARRMALCKGKSVADRYPEAWVVGADTVVTIDGLILGKPDDANDALSILKRLNGQEHEVITAYSVICCKQGVEQVRAVSTRVFFHAFSEAVLRGYIHTGEPMDKAGAYGIQGIGSFLVRKIEGSCSNVIGLPLGDLIADMLRYQLIAPAGE
jgi:septum formation protein